MNTNEKLREALKYLRDASREFCHLIHNSKYNEVMDKYKYAEVAKIRDAIANANAALALPRRNCDVGTAEEQGTRLLASFEKWREDAANNRMRLVDAVLEWAQMPYEEVK